MKHAQPVAPRPRSRRALPVVAAIATLVAVAGCSGDTAQGASTNSSADSTVAAALADSAPASTLALPVVAEPARDADLILRVTTTGQVRSDAVVTLRADVPGTVDAIRARQGARVTKGELLLSLDQYPFDLAVREARATADEAEQRFLESYVPESLVTGRAPTPEQRKALMNKAGLTGARLKLERAQFEQKRSAVTSPIDGMVDAILVAPGERIAGGQQLLTVVDTRHLRIEAQVLEHDLPMVRVGGDARITSAGAPGRVILGRIDAVLPLVDSITRAGRAIIRVNGDGTLRPGMYADVQLEATRLPSRRLVPAKSVIERDGRPLVFVIKDGRAQWTYVFPGRTNGLETELLPDSTTGEIPVRPGDAVIVEGHLTLTHDAPVKTLPPRRP